jgi:hypothetical protein
MASNQLSALSSQGRVSDIQVSNNGTPGPSHQGYQIVPGQNQLAMTRLSRRQLSYGQNQLGKDKSKVSNQVIAAYGDPRDTKLIPPSRSSNKEDVDKHDVELSDSEDSDEMISENQDTIREGNQELLVNVKNPFIPKLDLV